MIAQVQRLGDDKYRLLAPLKLAYGPEVPAGFECDGMSSPKWLNVFDIGDEKFDQLECAIAHDWAYSKYGGCSRYQADCDFYRNLRSKGYHFPIAETIYAAVRACGASHYDGDKND